MPEPAHWKLLTLYLAKPKTSGRRNSSLLILGNSILSTVHHNLYQAGSCCDDDTNGPPLSRAHQDTPAVTPRVSLHDAERYQETRKETQDTIHGLQDTASRRQRSGVRRIEGRTGRAVLREGCSRDGKSHTKICHNRSGYEGPDPRGSTRSASRTTFCRRRRAGELWDRDGEEEPLGLVGRYYKERVLQRLNQALRGREGILSHSCGNIMLQFCCVCISSSQSTRNNPVSHSCREMW